MHVFAQKSTDNTEQENNSNYIERNDFLFISVLSFLFSFEIGLPLK